MEEVRPRKKQVYKLTSEPKNQRRCSLRSENLSLVICEDLNWRLELTEENRRSYYKKTLLPPMV